jgi:hypothetical protein
MGDKSTFCYAFIKTNEGFCDEITKAWTHSVSNYGKT